MAPVAAAGLVMIASLMVVAAAIGAVGGVITALVGLLPLTLTFLVTALTTGWLRTRIPRPMAALVGLMLGLRAGFFYMLPLKFGIWAPMDKGTLWIAMVILLGLAARSIWRRRRVPTT
jgi:hypothetical protein